MTTTKLRELLDYWQAALRLSDWDIEVYAAPRASMDGDDGECEAYPEIKEAVIRVVRGKPSSEFADHETILVHELLHCHMEPLRTDENNASVELVVEDLSKAFVRMRRGA